MEFIRALEGALDAPYAIALRGFKGALDAPYAVLAAQTPGLLEIPSQFTPQFFDHWCF